MATNPKIKACPDCKTGDYMAVYEYENGARYVECGKCWRRSPGAGSIRQAIKLHNAAVTETADH